MKKMRIMLFVASFLFSVSAWPQSFQGSFRGKVVDPAGAVTEGAKLTLINESTQVRRTTATNNQGEFVFAAVTPATYTVVVEAAGFKRLERHGVAITTQSNTTLDLALEIGRISEEVTVSAPAPLVQNSDASNGLLLDNQKITDLPSLGRNPFLAAKLAETVVLVGSPKSTRMQDQNANSQVSVLGGPVRSNNYLIDGVSISDITNRATILPSPEAVQEIKLQSSTYDAEVGRSAGGTFNSVLRSGANQLHGSAIGSLRQTDWQANTFFANRAGTPRVDQPFRNWAGSIGGPVEIPGLYDGKNKTFFFFTTEHYTEQDASSTRLSVPTALERIGDYSQSFTKSGALQVIYDPLTTKADGTRTAFAGNVIPQNRLSAIGQKLASYLPLPNVPTAYFGAPNYDVSISVPNYGDQSTAKVDHQFFPWLKVSGSYVHQTTQEHQNAWWSGPSTPGQTTIDRATDATQANAQITPDPTTVISVRWGFNRFYDRTYPSNSYGFNQTDLGFSSSLANATPNPAFPSISLNDFTSFGGGTTQQDVYASRNFNASISKFISRHSLKAGFDFRALHDTGTPSTGPSSFSFTDAFTRANARNSTAGSGSALASLLLGNPLSGSTTLTSKFDYFLHYFGFFIHDDFRVNSKLTLNFGIRFEHESGLQESNNKLAVGFDQAATNPLQSAVPSLKLNGVVQFAGVDGNPTHTFNPLSLKPGPRFGFAYSLNNKTSIRGGYGIFWAPIAIDLREIGAATGYSQTTQIVGSLDNNFTPNPSVSLANPYPTGLIQPAGNTQKGLSGIGQSLNILNPNTKSGGYIQQYSFDIQREIGEGFAVTLGFLGSHSLHLAQNRQNIDQLDPSYFSLGAALNQSVANPLYNNGGVGSVGSPTITRSQLLSPFPQFTSVLLYESDTASSRYYAGYIRVQKQLQNGLAFLASYTWSRNMDNIVGLGGLFSNSASATAAGPQNAYNPSAEWGLSTQDVPHRFTTSITYELPFGKKQRFANNFKALDWAFGGWSVNLIGLVQSGYPLGITQNNANSVVGASYQRPNATGISAQTSGAENDRINGWLNPAAFQAAPQFTFGNVSRTIGVRSPQTYNLDLSLFKTVSIKERAKVQFRAEAFNVTNTVLFGSPNTNISSSSFGVITSQSNFPRLIQLGARVSF